MTKWMRRLLVLTILALLGLYPLLAPPAHRIDQAHCDRITAGMTRQQVEGILGVPAGDYDWAEAEPHSLFWSYVVFTERRDQSRQTQRFYGEALELAAVPQHLVINEVNLETSPIYTIRPGPITHARWTSRHGAFTVWFDERGLVTSATRDGDVKIVPPWQRWWRKYSGK